MPLEGVFSLEDGDDLPILIDTSRQRDVVDFCPGFGEEILGRHRAALIVQTREPEGVVFRKPGSYLPDPAGPSMVQVVSYLVAEKSPSYQGVRITCGFDWDGRHQEVNVQISEMNQAEVAFLDDVGSLPLSEQGQVIFDRYFRRTIAEFIQEWQARQERIASKTQEQHRHFEGGLYGSQLARDLERQNYEEVQRLKEEFRRQFGSGKLLEELQQLQGELEKSAPRREATGLFRISQLLARKPP